MHISYEEAVATPVQVVVRQLEYKTLENQIKQMKQSNAKP